jgi:hypothetical protein
MADGRHEAGVGVPTPSTASVDSAEITINGQPLQPQVPSTLANQVKHYAKAVVGALIAGLTYFLTVLAPAATLGDITLMQWIGFWVVTLSTLIGVAAVPNGAKPVKK